MPRYIKYRGAGKVPIVKATLFPGEETKTDPRMKVWPRADWVNPGEKIPVTRHKSDIYSQSAPIPARAKKG